MQVTILNAVPIPALKYGGTERVIWDLGKGLVNKGHKVTYIVPKSSYCDFAPLIEFDPKRTLSVYLPRRNGERRPGMQFAADEGIGLDQRWHPREARRWPGRTRHVHDRNPGAKARLNESLL